MIKKVLIAEDHESANLSVQKTLESLDNIQPDYVYYCDDALLKIKKGMQDGLPYDLLITDLYFEQDGQAQQLSGGAALIAAARQIQPDLRILVFSAENKAAVIDMLYEKERIDGYVRKARLDARELKEAINSIARQQRYFPRHLMQLVKQKNTYEFSEFDITIISLLAGGMLIKDMPDHLNKHKIRPSGLSSIEKRFNHIKESMSFNNNEQLVAYCKDMGLI
jgi:DNA-binding NarL/FixJ family response regulator